MSRSDGGWSELGRLDGADRTPELVCERLVGERVFPGLELGEEEHGFESEILDEELPTTHELMVAADSIEYRLHTHDEETRKVRAKVIFDALAAAVSKLHGKVKGKHKRWELGGRDIVLTMASLSGG